MLLGPRAHRGVGGGGVGDRKSRMHVLRVDEGQDFGALAAAQWEILRLSMSPVLLIRSGAT